MLLKTSSVNLTNECEHRLLNIFHHQTRLVRAIFSTFALWRYAPMILCLHILCPVRICLNDFMPPWILRLHTFMPLNTLPKQRLFAPVCRNDTFFIQTRVINGKIFPEPRVRRMSFYLTFACKIIHTSTQSAWTYGYSSMQTAWTYG